MNFYDEETMQEILEECQEYADNCQQSEEDGWFYPDGNKDQD